MEIKRWQEAIDFLKSKDYKLIDEAKEQYLLSNINNTIEWIITIEFKTFILFLWKWVMSFKFAPDNFYSWMPHPWLDYTNLFVKWDNLNLEDVYTELWDNLELLKQEWIEMATYELISDKPLSFDIESKAYKQMSKWRKWKTWLKWLFVNYAYFFNWDKYDDINDYVSKAIKQKRRATIKKPLKDYSEENWFQVKTIVIENNSNDNLNLIKENLDWIYERFINKKFVGWNEFKRFWDIYKEIILKDFEIATNAKDWKIMLTTCFFNWEKIWARIAHSRFEWESFNAIVWTEEIERFPWLWKRLILDQMQTACENDFSINYSMSDCNWKELYKLDKEAALLISLNYL